MSPPRPLVVSVEATSTQGWERGFGRCWKIIMHLKPIYGHLYLCIIYEYIANRRVFLADFTLVGKILFI